MAFSLRVMSIKIVLSINTFTFKRVQQDPLQMRTRHIVNICSVHRSGNVRAFGDERSHSDRQGV